MNTPPTRGDGAGFHNPAISSSPNRADTITYPRARVDVRVALLRVATMSTRSQGGVAGGLELETERAFLYFLSFIFFHHISHLSSNSIVYIRTGLHFIGGIFMILTRRLIFLTSKNDFPSSLESIY